MRYKDYYGIMGLDRAASIKDIKLAYRRLAHKYHPDVSKVPDSEEKFKEINEAYKILKNPQKRATFDKLEAKLAAEWRAFEKFSSSAPPPKQKLEIPPILQLFGVLFILTLCVYFWTPFGSIISFIMLIIYLYSRN